MLRVPGLGLRFEGLRFKVYDLACKVQGVKFRTQVSQFAVSSSGFRM